MRKISCIFTFTSTKHLLAALCVMLPLAGCFDMVRNILGSIASFDNDIITFLQKSNPKMRMATVRDKESFNKLVQKIGVIKIDLSKYDSLYEVPVSLVFNSVVTYPTLKIFYNGDIEEPGTAGRAINLLLSILAGLLPNTNDLESMHMGIGNLEIESINISAEITMPHCSFQDSKRVIFANKISIKCLTIDLKQLICRLFVFVVLDTFSLKNSNAVDLSILDSVQFAGLESNNLIIENLPYLEDLQTEFFGQTGISFNTITLRNIGVYGYGLSLAARDVVTASLSRRTIGTLVVPSGLFADLIRADSFCQNIKIVMVEDVSFELVTSLRWKSFRPKYFSQVHLLIKNAFDSPDPSKEEISHYRLVRLLQETSTAFPRLKELHVKGSLSPSFLESTGNPEKWAKGIKVSPVLEVLTVNGQVARIECTVVPYLLHYLPFVPSIRSCIVIIPKQVYGAIKHTDIRELLLPPYKACKNFNLCKGVMSGNYAFRCPICLLEEDEIDSQPGDFHICLLGCGHYSCLGCVRAQLVQIYDTEIPVGCSSDSTVLKCPLCSLVLYAPDGALLEQGAGQNYGLKQVVITESAVKPFFDKWCQSITWEESPEHQKEYKRWKNPDVLTWSIPLIHPSISRTIKWVKNIFPKQRGPLAAGLSASTAFFSPGLSIWRRFLDFCTRAVFFIGWLVWWGMWCLCQCLSFLVFMVFGHLWDAVLSWFVRIQMEEGD
ncbi:hypothetical protein NEDG_01887 [Nematocida displodere]|uniref:RING-type domain-containing protein n=1 Tax=Nematocida displodere TaxID=1805483 RepID=A0A177EGM5_9MICR|nr:hypothetical protein NEDG_01887 [Nematocida displodere]